MGPKICFDGPAHARATLDFIETTLKNQVDADAYVRYEATVRPYLQRGPREKQLRKLQLKRLRTLLARHEEKLWVLHNELAKRHNDEVPTTEPKFLLPIFDLPHGNTKDEDENREPQKAEIEARNKDGIEINNVKEVDEVSLVGSYSSDVDPMGTDSPMVATEPFLANSTPAQDQLLPSDLTKALQSRVQQEERPQLLISLQSYLAWQDLRDDEFPNLGPLPGEFEDISKRLGISPDTAFWHASSHYIQESRHRLDQELDNQRLDEPGYRDSKHTVGDSQVDESILHDVDWSKNEHLAPREF